MEIHLLEIMAKARVCLKEFYFLANRQELTKNIKALKFVSLLMWKHLQHGCVCSSAMTIIILRELSQLLYFYIASGISVPKGWLLMAGFHTLLSALTGTLGYTFFCSTLCMTHVDGSALLPLPKSDCLMPLSVLDNSNQICNPTCWSSSCFRPPWLSSSWLFTC